MTKIVTAAVTTLFLTASPLAYAQAPGAGALQRLSTADVTALTDARINLVKAALQLTPDQEKYWPAIEEAIRARAKDRQARLQNVEARITELRSKSPVEAMRDRNPVDFLHRRAEAYTTSSRPQETRRCVAAALSDSEPRAEAAHGCAYHFCVP